MRDRHNAGRARSATAQFYSAVRGRLFLIAFFSLATAVCLAGPPEVEIIDMDISGSGRNSTVSVNYRYRDAEGDILSIGLQASRDDGVTWDAVPVFDVFGDTTVFAVPEWHAGQLHWGAGTDWPEQISSRMRVRITAAKTAAEGFELLMNGDFQEAVYGWDNVSRHMGDGAAFDGGVSVVNGAESPFLHLAGTQESNYYVTVKQTIPLPELPPDARFVLSFDWRVPEKETPYGRCSVHVRFFDVNDDCIGEIVTIDTANTSHTLDALRGDLPVDAFHGERKYRETFDWERVFVSSTHNLSGLDLTRVRKVCVTAEIQNDAGSGGIMDVANISLGLFGTGIEERLVPRVTFEMGGHGMRTGGGEMVQDVRYGKAAVEPDVRVAPGWEFTGWDADVSAVTSALLVTAQYAPTGGDPPQGFVFVEAGTTPGGEVTVADSFFIRKHEVTNAEVAAMLRWAVAQDPPLVTKGRHVKTTTGEAMEIAYLEPWTARCQVEYYFSGETFLPDHGKQDYPWVEAGLKFALAYCNFLSMKEGFSPAYDLSDWTSSPGAQGYRLPTTSEWEYAARGGKNGTNTQFSGSDTADEVAWHWDNSATDGSSDFYMDRGTHPVGTKASNELGIHDMSGNALEWCHDVEAGESLLAGGCWQLGPQSCTVAAVFHDSGYLRAEGFRPVLPASAVSSRGDLFVRVLDHNGSPKSGVIVQHNQDPNDEKITDIDGRTEPWTNLQAGVDHRFEAYFEGENPFDSLGEYWCTGTVTLDGDDREITLERSWPYAEDIRMYDSTTGEELSVSSIIEPGTEVRVDVTLRNKLGTARAVNCFVVFDRDRQRPWDWDHAGVPQSADVPPGGTVTSTFHAQFPTPGYYYYALWVKTSDGTDFYKTDAWDWGPAFDVASAEDREYDYHVKLQRVGATPFAVTGDDWDTDFSDEPVTYERGARINVKYWPGTGGDALYRFVLPGAELVDYRRFTLRIHGRGTSALTLELGRLSRVWRGVGAAEGAYSVVIEAPQDPDTFLDSGPQQHLRCFDVWLKPGTGNTYLVDKLELEVEGTYNNPLLNAFLFVNALEQGLVETEHLMRGWDFGDTDGFSDLAMEGVGILGNWLQDAAPTPMEGFGFGLPVDDVIFGISDVLDAMLTTAQRLHDFSNYLDKAASVFEGQMNQTSYYGEIHEEHNRWPSQIAAEIAVARQSLRNLAEALLDAGADGEISPDEAISLSGPGGELEVVSSNLDTVKQGMTEFGLGMANRLYGKRTDREFDEEVISTYRGALDSFAHMVRYDYGVIMIWEKDTPEEYRQYRGHDATVIYERSFLWIAADTLAALRHELQRQAEPDKSAISGFVTRDDAGVSNVRVTAHIRPADGNPSVMETLTSSDGSYTLLVPEGARVTLAFAHEGYLLTPADIDLGAVSRDRPQNATAVPRTFTISGTVTLMGNPFSGIIVAGLPDGVVTDQNGDFEAVVDYGWQGFAEPLIAGFSFVPPDRAIGPVAHNLPNQDFVVADDAFEPNNTRQEAAPVSFGLHDNLACLDWDYYAVTVDSVVDLTLGVTVQAGSGQPELVLFAPDGTAHDVALAVEGEAEILHEWAEAGTYVLFVMSQTGTPFAYHLNVTTAESLPHMVTFDAEANGALTGDTSQAVYHGTDSTPVTAEPNAGYSFLEWTVTNGTDNGIINVTENPLTIGTVTGDVAVTATFAINTYPVSFDLGAHAAWAGGGPLEQQVAHGQEPIEPELDVAAGWQFTDWDPALSTVTGPLTFVAQYNCIPQAVDDGDYTTPANYALTVTAPGVLGNDSDPEDDDLIATLLSDPTNGTVSLNDDGSFTYTPNTDYLGTDTFTYTTSDGKAESDPATVMVTVANPPPIIESFVLIPAGTNAGSDPDFYDYDLVIGTAFYMGTYEVHKALWDQVRTWGMNNGYTDLPPGGGKGPNHPVQYVGWYDVLKWCNARSEMEGRTPCYTVSGDIYRTGQHDTAHCTLSASGYRVPTCPEWEYAARGGLSGKRFPWGDTISHDEANYYGTDSYFYSYDHSDKHHPAYATGGKPYTSPVGSFEAGKNGYNLYDIIGNVCEWCLYSQSEGTAVPILRGGGWSIGGNYCRIGYLDGVHALYRGNGSGFRLCYASGLPPLTHTLTHGADANGVIEGEALQTVTHRWDGTPVTAVGNEGYRFLQWSDGETANPRSDSDLRSDISVLAKFIKEPADGEFVLIPAGTNDGVDPDFGGYSLTVENPFYMGTTEVTKSEWDTVRLWGLANGYTDLPGGSAKGPDHPVHSVNWYGAVKWCNARSEMQGCSPSYTVAGNVYRIGKNNDVTRSTSTSGFYLPTDEEWEYAARGGLFGQRFPWGNTIAHGNANYFSYSGYDYDISSTRGYHPTYDDGVSPRTSPAGSFAGNAYGMHDMAGNVWEWCSDWYPGKEGSSRVKRGGSWRLRAIACRAGARFSDYPRDSSNIGLRVCSTMAPAPLPHVLSYAVAAHGSIEGETSQCVVHGSDGSPVTAVAHVGFHFLQWNDGMTANPRTDTNVTANIVVTAQFIEKPADDEFVRIPAGTNASTNALAEGEENYWQDTYPETYSLTVSDFAIGKYEVTKGEWDTVCAWALNNGYTDLPEAGGKEGNHPVYSVSWYDVVKWCNALSEKENRAPCYTVSGDVYRTGELDNVDCDFSGSGYRLPTEMEWEYAARGGITGKRFPWGDTISHAEANYVGHPEYWSYDLSSGYHPDYDEGGQPFTSPAGSFENGKNGYGLYDMAGNVWEWCWDWFPGWEGYSRVRRGGSWRHEGWGAVDCRVGNSSLSGPDSGSFDGGFRICKTVESQ